MLKHIAVLAFLFKNNYATEMWRDAFLSDPRSRREARGNDQFF